MITMKIIQAFLLAALPFAYASYMRPKKVSTSPWRNMFTAIGSQLPRLKAVRTSISHFIHRLYEGMKKSDNCRKFFSLVTLLLMIAVQFIDYSASTAIAMTAQEQPAGSAETIRYISLYGSMMTRPYATLLAACISLVLFRYRLADIILTRLHNGRRAFFFVALLALVILFISTRYIIVTEIIEIMLIAAMIYPNKTPHEEPKGRQRLPGETEKQTIQKAA